MKTILRPFLRYLFSSGIVCRVNVLLFMALQLYSVGCNNQLAMPMWALLTRVILIFGPANLLGLGLLGIYIGRIFNEIKARPSYLVRETPPGIA